MIINVRNEPSRRSGTCLSQHVQWTDDSDIYNNDDDNENNDGDNNLQLSSEVEYHMKNYADQVWIDNTLQIKHNFSCHMKAD